MRALLFAITAATVACGGEAGFATIGAGGGAQTSATSATGMGASGGAGAGGSSSGGANGADADSDGIDDGVEAVMATDYFPYLSLDPTDQCPLQGVVYRLTPHPLDASKIHIWYDLLYERDCGLNGHVGDDEVFGVMADPQVAAAAGILAVRAISHQATLCERTTTCGTLPGCEACTIGTVMRPVVFSSKNKHGGYVKESTCDQNVVCDSGGCTLAAAPATPPMVNAGEPAAPLVSDLTAQGFITAANGWTEQALFGFDPWGSPDFGSAGNVADDLQDAAFVVDPAGCM